MIAGVRTHGHGFAASCAQHNPCPVGWTSCGVGNIKRNAAQIPRPLWLTLATTSPGTDPKGPTGDEILSEDEALEAPHEPHEPHERQPSSFSSQPALLRPGVVHRLDKGTTGVARHTVTSPEHQVWALQGMRTQLIVKCRPDRDGEGCQDAVAPERPVQVAHGGYMTSKAHKVSCFAWSDTLSPATRDTCSEQPHYPSSDY